MLGLGEWGSRLWSVNISEQIGPALLCIRALGSTHSGGSGEGAPKARILHSASSRLNQRVYIPGTYSSKLLKPTIPPSVTIKRVIRMLNRLVIKPLIFSDSAVLHIQTT